MKFCVLLVCLTAAVGCALVPETSQQPQVHNPFPQLAKVAVAPFFNQSTEPTVDGNAAALAYYSQLQQVPGFEVVPVATVATAIRQHGIQLRSPDDVRKLAQLLGVDAVVVGAVTDYSPYYPPRIGLHVEWYAANPHFHAIPPGYGLPLGTCEEEQIPSRLIFEAEMALARAQLETASPPYETMPIGPLPLEPKPLPEGEAPTELRQLSHRTTAPVAKTGTSAAPSPIEPAPVAGAAAPAPGPVRPVLQHTHLYDGHDAEVTAALASYYDARDDARFGGWQGYLQRSDDFMRFCCRHHIAAMLTARGGAGETRVQWRWPTDR